MPDDMTGRCKFCYYNRNLPWCKPEKMIAQSGSCQDWRMCKLSDADKANEKAKQADGYLKDKERRKLNRKQRKKGGRGGA